MIRKCEDSTVAKPIHEKIVEAVGRSFALNVQTDNQGKIKRIEYDDAGLTPAQKTAVTNYIINNNPDLVEKV